MKRIFSEFAYGPDPRRGCWWDDTCDMPEFPPHKGELTCDVAIVGAGFTGLNAALHLAESGVDVVVIDAKTPGWGASGRNGGFCCLGGAKASDNILDQRFGKSGRLAYRRAEKIAVSHVDGLIARLRLDVDRHSVGETVLAHRARHMPDLIASAERVVENYGVTPTLLEARELAGVGMNGPFHGAMTTPIGFALNPRKYIAGLVQAASDAGVRIFSHTPALSIGINRIIVTGGEIKAKSIVIATNGYSSDDLPKWLAARYMPTQSNVIVTRPLTGEEIRAQGWNSAQMAYDTRNLLHYFRLMPDGRFLFGMRGGLGASPNAEAAARRKIQANFAAMFPAWRDVEITHSWSGMVAVARSQVPFVGPVPKMRGVFAGLCYHGNGIAMGSLAGLKLAQMILDDGWSDLPEAITTPLSKFPFGRARRVIMPPVYAGLMVRDL